MLAAMELEDTRSIRIHRRFATAITLEENTDITTSDRIHIIKPARDTSQAHLTIAIAATIGSQRRFPITAMSAAAAVGDSLFFFYRGLCFLGVDEFFNQCLFGLFEKLGFDGFGDVVKGANA